MNFMLQVNKLNWKEDTSKRQVARFVVLTAALGRHAVSTGKITDVSEVGSSSIFGIILLGLVAPLDRR